MMNQVKHILLQNANCRSLARSSHNNAMRLMSKRTSKTVLKRDPHFSQRSRSMSGDGPQATKKGFAKAFEQQESMKQELNVISATVQNTQQKEVENESFASMIRKSPFVGLGDFKGRLLAGKVTEVQDNNLFIDYGGKFYCICRKPRENEDKFKRGSDVIIKLLKWELSARFLGSTKDITLLESEAILVDGVSS